MGNDILEIILNKKVNVYLLSECYSCVQYNTMQTEKNRKLTYKEFALIKKELEWRYKNV